MTFQDILIEEPRLISLIYEASKVAKYASGDNRSEIWYRDLKHQMVRLVGFESASPKLCGSEPYDMVYQFFIELLKI